ncbi:MAG: peptidylprolyl isomerase [Candidatus Krumholzibacteriota bacterium]|nr:peptidylprolyl isomerase [Candidatus Krumholzibacteriota bacterium]
MREIPPGAIVRVGERVLTVDELDRLLPEGERVPFDDAERRRFVDRWVDTELLHQEAIRRRLGDDPRVQARRAALEQEYLADHLLTIELRERTSVTEEEVERYFEEHREEYLYEYRVSHILVNTLEEARQVQALLETNSFEWVANRHSVDPVAKRGGDLGYLTKGNMVPEFENVIFRMTPGEVSGPVRSDFGFHIIKLVGIREAYVKVGLEEVRERIMNTLVVRKRERAYGEFLDELRRRSEIEYADSAYAVPAFADTAASGGTEVN